MPVDGFQCIFRATREKPAVGSENRRYNELVNSYNGQKRVLDLSALRNPVCKGLQRFKCPCGMNTCGRFFGYDVYIDAFFSSQWMYSKEFPHDTFDPISDDGVSDFACYGNPDAGMPDAVRLRFRLCVLW